MTRMFAMLLALGVFLVDSEAQSQNYGTFSGGLHFEWLKDGRNMRLLTPFGYTDPSGREWDVPPGAITDGASIPRVLWAFAGPFEGQYRDAAVVHDFFCVVRTRTWRDTHQMFYSAMRAAGVDAVTAKTMYGAVYYFGPRWGIGAASKGPGAEQGLTLEEEKQLVNNLRLWIEKSDPDIQDIDRQLDTSGPPIPG
jgi:hypothetical protein